MELGGDFELDVTQLRDVDDHLFNYLESYDTVYTDSGRSALRLLKRMLPKGNVLLPAYICESVIKEFREDYEITFYGIKRDFSVDLEDLKKKLDEQVAVVYLMHYFGGLQEDSVLEYLKEMKQKDRFIIIEDTTHSIFTRSHTIGDYCICSLRKWFPIMDGGVLYALTQLPVVTCELKSEQPSKRLDAMVLKHLYINEGLDCNALYRSIFLETEHQLDEQEDVYGMSPLSQVILKGISISEMCEKRRLNYEAVAMFLADKKWKSALTGGEIVPLAYPVYVSDRNRFRNYLIDHQIYCAVHWPLEGTELENHSDAKWISDHILSFPIDQRYDELHMKYLEAVINNYE